MKSVSEVIFSDELFSSSDISEGFAEGIPSGRVFSSSAIFEGTSEDCPSRVWTLDL